MKAILYKLKQLKNKYLLYLISKKDSYDANDLLKEKINRNNLKQITVIRNLTYQGFVNDKSQQNLGSIIKIVNIYRLKLL